MATVTNEINILFPAKEVVLSNGVTTVVVTPLSLEHLPKVADSFGILMKLAEEGSISPPEIAAKALGEVLKIVPYCIDIPACKIPAYDVPDILEIVVEQNITEDTVGKWMSLVQKVVDLSGQGELIEAAKKKTSPK